MKRILILLCLPMLFTTCKKEENNYYVSSAVYGCTDPNALNYNPNATQDDSSCVYCVYGCTDTAAINYMPTATCDDSSCVYFNPTASFSCKIDGIQLSDSSPIGHIITTNPALNGVLEISGTSNLPNGRVMNTVYLTIYNFSSVTENTNLTLGFPADGFAIVNIGIDEYITDSPPYIGIINFSKITSNKVSGTFTFDAHFGTAGACSVTEGSFSDVSY